LPAAHLEALFDATMAVNLKGAFFTV